jgi:AcrR family transcriptional regulator
MTSQAIPQSPPRTGRDERRDNILKVAYAAFLNEGFAATSMSSIAAKVGGSKATLYNYFASKEELFAAVIDEKCQEIGAVIFETEANLGSFRDALIHLATRFMEIILEDEKIAVFRLVTAETARFPELGRAFFDSGPRQAQERLAAFFDRAIQNGDLERGDALMMAGQFFNLCRGELHHRKLWSVTPEPGPDEIKKHVVEAVRIFLSAYGANPPSSGATAHLR